MDVEYPGYGFAANKGYGTPAHEAAIREVGSLSPGIGGASTARCTPSSAFVPA
jgi:ribonuclease HII